MLNALNKAINEVFLGGRFESRPLFLVLDNQGRDQLASLAGIEPDEVEDHCCSVVGAALSKTGNPYGDFEHELWRWTLTGRKSPPPFTTLLYVLSHAAELMVSDGDFSAGNYYDRLSAIVNVPPQKLSQHGSATEPFWRAFNGWLADNDFAFGRPTARAINGFKYVGIAMSQAIIREADRQRFHMMFEKYGFTNTDDLSASELEQYISTWIHTSQPTKQLKEAWKKTELRPRICEAAVSELEEWQAEKASKAGQTTGASRLSLALSIRHDFLGRSAALYFGREQPVEPIRVELRGGGELELSNTTFAGFATLEPRSSIPISHCLLHGMELGQGEDSQFKWSGRPAIPLSRSDQGYWSEVSRVSLGIEHLVLVRDDSAIRRAIEGALEEAAAPGYTLATPDKLKGLPPGWVLYEKVVIRRALAELRGFESVLSPVGEAASLRLDGGMKLGRGIYHRKCVPAARLDGDQASVAISVWEGSSPEGKALCSLTSGDGSLSLDLADCVPESGNVFVEGKTGKSTVASASLLFRSADRPRPLDRQERSIARYTGILSSSLQSRAEVPTIRGLRIPSLPAAEFDLATLDSFTSLERPPAVQPAPEAAVDGARVLSRAREVVQSIRGLPPEQVLALPCAVRGLHRLRYAPVLPGTPRYAPVDVECPDCGITYLHRPARPAAAGVTRRQNREAVPFSPAKGVDDAQRPIDHDLWLDGACFLGAGSATVFETFAASGDVDTWRSGPVLRDLAWLGHLDIETGATYRAKSWSVSPPVLSMTGPKSAVLAGFRCEALIDSLRQEVEIRGGELIAKRRSTAPTVVRIEGLPEEILIELAAGIRDPHGRSLQVVSGAAEAILAFLVGRSRIAEIFRPVSLGSGVPVQRYDVAKNRWRDAEHVQGAGAYRVAEAGTSYVYLAPSGRAFSGPHELVKLAAARVAGIKLHAYDRSTSKFSCWVGCEPTGLLGRALVACGGYLPTIEQGISTFNDVRPGVAAGVLKFLYDGELPA